MGSIHIKKKKSNAMLLRSSLPVVVLATFICMSVMAWVRAFKHINDNDGLSVEALLFSTSLARDQSNGFFSDVSNENWKIAQEHHAALFPNYYQNLKAYSNGPDDKGKGPEKLGKSSHWNGENFQVEFICPLARRLPPDSMADGPKWVCDPHRIKKQKDCLVYSVGSNGKVEFEKAVKEEIGEHCEIHSECGAPQY